MLWKLLRTTQGYEMPATQRFPTTERFCLERWAVLSLYQGPALPRSDSQRGGHRVGGSQPVLHESLESATTRT